MKTKPETIEFDPSIDAWYVRFRTAKLAKTISEDKPGPVVAVDMDARNRVIGIEIIGPSVPAEGKKRLKAAKPKPNAE
jgi:uncharacterized protein YuzE